MESCGSSLDYRRLCTCRRRYRNLRHSGEPKPRRGQTPQGTLEDMLTCFEFLFPLVYDNLELLEHLAFDFVKRQHEQNVIYTEVRYSPHLLATDPRKAHEAITCGLRKGCEHYKTIVNQILCAINFCPQWSKDIVEMADSYRQDFPCAVVGVDIAAGEDHFSADSPHRQGHFEMCQRAKELGLNITIHAGETPDSAQNVQKAIDEYGAKRIGHAYIITNYPKIMDLVKARKVHLEICPTSSVETGGWEKTDWRDHPACIFRENGLSMSLSSDDPAVFNTSLTWQYRIALKKMRWEQEEILETLEDAIEAAFLPEDEKTGLRQTIRDYSVGPNPVFADRVHYD
jgi:adenosine deaminase